MLPCELQETLKGFFEQREEVLFAYLFGSQAQGKEGPLSDVDIALYQDEGRIVETRYGYKAEIINKLAALTGQTTDLVILNTAPLYLAFQVLKTGVLLFCRCEERREAFHFQVLQRYLDFKPMMAVQNQYLERRIRDGSFGGVIDR